MSQEYNIVVYIEEYDTDTHKVREVGTRDIMRGEFLTLDEAVNYARGLLGVDCSPGQGDA